MRIVHFNDNLATTVDLTDIDHDCSRGWAVGFDVLRLQAEDPDFRQT